MLGMKFYLILQNITNVSYQFSEVKNMLLLHFKECTHQQSPLEVFSNYAEKPCISSSGYNNRPNNKKKCSINAIPHLDFIYVAR